MKKFDNEIITQAKRAVYQEKPIIQVTLDEEEIGLSISGSKVKLEKALRTAMNSNSDFKQMCRNALSAPKPTDSIRYQNKFNVQMAW